MTRYDPHKLDLKAALPAELPRQYPMAVFAIAEIKSEITRLRKATGITGKPAADIEDWEWSDFMTDLARWLGPIPPESDSDLKTALADYEDQLRCALHIQCGRALKALDYAGNLHGSSHSHTQTVLLPVSYAQRIERLIGVGELPVIWVYRLDVLKC